jgi:hypothetical protein
MALLALSGILSRLVIGEEAMQVSVPILRMYWRIATCAGIILLVASCAMAIYVVQMSM